jgi:hypothetical protein
VFAAAALVVSIKPALAQTAAPPAPAAEPAPPAPAPTPPSSQPSAELEKQVAVQRADIDEQDARIQELERQLKELKKAESPKVPVAATVAKADQAPGGPPASDVDPKFPLKVSGYFQAQYESHQDSEDQLLPGGSPLNQNRFVLRRARVKLAKDWQYGGVMFELDANSVKGPSFGMQHAEVSLAYRNEDLSPLAQVTLGLFDNPFGREVVESPRERPFMERSYASREFFPTEPDLGLRVSGQIAFFRYAVAVVNGQPLGDRTGFVLQDPNSHKDVLGRVGVDVMLPSALRVIGGVSVLNGKGFHPGTDATKNTVVWKDNISEDGLIQIPELVGVPGAAATPSQNFTRWLLGADLGFELASKLGVTHLYGEISVASNMDRNVFVADPVTTGLDEREFGYYVALYHEFKSGPIAGFRFDKYDPNSDFLDSRAGKLLPVTETITTYSPLIGFQVPHKARLVAQYDVIKDSLGRNDLGVPTDKKNNVWTIRLQGEL